VFIGRARDLGFRLGDIRAMIGLGAPGGGRCEDVLAIAQHHLEEIRSELRDLRALEEILAAAVSRCTGERAPKCAVLDLLDLQYSTEKGEPSALPIAAPAHL
jgi:MerR family mercuric resistance operon transcriptional regulator